MIGFEAHAPNKTYTKEFLRTIRENSDVIYDPITEIYGELHAETKGMSKAERDRIVYLMKRAALQNIDTGRLDGKYEDVVPVEDAIAIVDSVYKENERYT